MPSLSSVECLGEVVSVEPSNRNRARDEIATIPRGLKSGNGLSRSCDVDIGILRVPVPLRVFAILEVVGIGGFELLRGCRVRRRGCGRLRRSRCWSSRGRRRRRPAGDAAGCAVVSVLAGVGGIGVRASASACRVAASAAAAMYAGGVNGVGGTSGEGAGQ